MTLAQTLDFSGFLNHPQTVASLQAQPYGHYVTDAAGVEQAALFVRLEHWRDDLAGFVGVVTDLPVANASSRARDWRGFYSAADAELVARVCAADIARSDYRFDPAR